jgi:NADH:ubiquinone reductase (non-electrogenic)
VGPTPFITKLPFAKTARGRIAIDEFLHALVPRETADPKEAAVSRPELKAAKEQKGTHGEDWLALPNVFALGDCSANKQEPLPALAQVAEQQGKYLAHHLNQEAKARKNGQGAAKEPQLPPFKYKHLGSMATVGGASAVIDLTSSRGRISWTGFTSWLAWRSAYLTRLGSFRNRLNVAVNWFVTLISGRDISAW